MFYYFDSNIRFILIYVTLCFDFFKENYTLFNLLLIIIYLGVMFFYHITLIYNIGVFLLLFICTVLHYSLFLRKSNKEYEHTSY